MKQKTMPLAFVCIITLIASSLSAQPSPTTRPTATTRPAVRWVNPKLPEERFGAEDQTDWDEWVHFFSRTREFDGRLKGLVEINP